MLNLNDITLTYPDGGSTVTAINHANLAVNPGEFAAVTGPSGSGKSSLLSVAATLTSPDSGSVAIAGIETTTLNQKHKSEVRRDHIGIVFQSPNLIPSLTVARCRGHARPRASPPGRPLRWSAPEGQHCPRDHPPARGSARG